MTSFNIHNAFTFSITGKNNKPLEDYLEKHLGYFKADVDNPDLEIEIVKALPHYKMPLDNVRGGWGADEDFFYIDRLGKKVAMTYDIENTENLKFLCEAGFRAGALVNRVIEPMMQLFFIKRGFTIIHASAVSKGDRGFCIGAFPRSGKTNVILSLVLKDKYDFLSDDFTIINKEGMVFPYPNDISIQAHNIKIFPSLSDAVTGSYLEKTKIGLQGWLATRYHRYFRQVNRVIPEKYINRLIPVSGADYRVYTVEPESIGKIGQPSKISKLFLLLRENDSAKVKISRVDNLEPLATRLAANLLFERVGVWQDYFTYLFAFPDKRCGLLENSLNLQRDIIIGALSKAQCYQINIPENIPFEESFAEYRHLIDETGD